MDSIEYGEIENEKVFFRHVPVEIQYKSISKTTLHKAVLILIMY